MWNSSRIGLITHKNLNPVSLRDFVPRQQSCLVFSEHHTKLRLSRVLCPKNAAFVSITEIAYE